MGVFEINSVNGTNNVVYKLANTTEVGTYRFLFTIKDLNNNTIYEIPYAIIICDKINN